MYKAAALIMAIALAVFIVSKAFDKKDTPKDDGAKTVAAESKAEPVKAKAAMEISASKKLGEAGTLVRSFFRNWEYTRFDEMHDQTVNSRRKDFFVKCLKQTPINCRNVEILSEKRVGDDWDVELALEVTDVTSALAALVVNTIAPPGNNSDHIFRFSPHFLKIERFMKLKQTWRVVSLDGKNLIDIGARDDSGIERHSNIMNYVLDTGVIDHPPPRGPEGWTSDQQLNVSAEWLTEAEANLNKTVADTDTIMKEAKPLVAVGFKNLLLFVKALKESRDESEHINIPEGATF